MKAVIIGEGDDRRQVSEKDVGRIHGRSAVLQIVDDGPAQVRQEWRAQVDCPYLIRYSDGVRHTVLLSEEADTWLNTCHPTRAERDKIIARFRFEFGLLSEFGLAIGKPHIDRIDGYDNLWEIRVGHRTGAYRSFFGLAADGSIILVAYGAVKKRDRFPASVYQLAAQKVREAVARYDEERRAEDGRSQFVPAP